MSKKILILFFCILFSSFVSFAETIGPAPESTTSTNVPLSNKNHRPKDTSQLNLYCVYSDGSLFFYFDEDEGMATITVNSLTSSYCNYYSIPALGSNYIQMTTLPGTYEIEIDTSRGGEYIGYLTIY